MLFFSLYNASAGLSEKQKRLEEAADPESLRLPGP
jgi:hypothetical protein